MRESEYNAFLKTFEHSTWNRPIYESESHHPARAQMKYVCVLLLLTLLFVPPPTSAGIVTRDQYNPLPVGTVEPQGWLRAQLFAQKHGIGGRWLGANSRVNDSRWLGGNGASLWKGAQAYPYWLNGAVPLAAALRDPELTAEVVRQISLVFELAEQNDGWYGPLDLISGWETGRCNDHGPRVNGSCGVSFSPFRFLSAVIQYSEAFPNDNRTVPSLYAFAAKLLKVIQKQPLRDEWAVNRWQEPLLAFTWLLHKHPGTPEQLNVVMELIATLRHQGFDWDQWVASNATHPFRNGSAPTPLPTTECINGTNLFGMIVCSILFDAPCAHRCRGCTGGDLSHSVSVASQQACLRLCSSNDLCSAYVYEKCAGGQHCYLKRGGWCDAVSCVH